MPKKEEFITVWPCPKCKKTEVYFYDKEGNDVTDIKKIRSFKCHACGSELKFSEPLFKLK